MTELTRDEREAFRSLDQDSLRQPKLSDSQRLVQPTPRARLDYIRFATDASRFYRGRREIRFRGENWRL